MRSDLRFNEAEDFTLRKLNHLDPESVDAAVASMRPKILLFGNILMHIGNKISDTASMRPKILLFGNLNTNRKRDQWTRASMRPKILLFGNSLDGEPSFSRCPSFNEAEDFTLRKSTSLN